MRYRALSPTGDYMFGLPATYLVDSPAAVAQAIGTRLRLQVGEWFLDNRVGLDINQILGYGTQSTRDEEVKQTILDTTGVESIASYSSSVNDRAFTVTAVVNTIYGATTITEIL